MTFLDHTVAAGVQPASDCDHSGLHSPMAWYSRESAELRYVTVCDACGAETREVNREPYTPTFNPSGNDPYVTRPATA